MQRYRPCPASASPRERFVFFRRLLAAVLMTWLGPAAGPAGQKPLQPRPKMREPMMRVDRTRPRSAPRDEPVGVPARERGQSPDQIATGAPNPAARLHPGLVPPGWQSP